MPSCDPTPPDAPSTPTRQGKRKADEQGAEVDASRHEAEDTWEITTPEKPQPLESASKPPRVKKPKASAEPVQLKNGKLVLKQKAKSFLDEISVLLGLTQLKIFCQTHSEPISQLPNEHLGIIAKFAQESDKTSTELSRMIKQKVMGSQDSGFDVLPLATIESAVSQVAQRVNYGLDPSDVASSSTSNQVGELPPGLQCWRWEVTDSSLLQPEREAEILARREERIVARAKALEIFQALSVSEREAVLSCKKKAPTKMAKGKSSEGTDQIDDPESKCDIADSALSQGGDMAGPDSADGADESTKLRAQVQERRGSVTSSRESKSPERALKAGKKKVELTPEEVAEKERKDAERDEKRRQKEAKEAKKIKQIEQTKKAASMMSGFFGMTASPSKEMKASTTQASPLTVMVSDFERTFVPIVYKNVAPVNRLATEVTAESIDRALETNDFLTKDQMLSAIASKMPKRKKNTGTRARLSVRDTMRMVAESDLMTAAAQSDAHKALETLKDRRSRKAVPVKLLQFATDLRPGYFGTWTRPSNLISGRRPLRQDPVALDYNYDSECDWVDGGDGEDDTKGEEVGDDNDDMEDAMSGSEAESEMADWLVDDLEEDEEAADFDDAMSDIIEVDPLGNPLSPVLGRNLVNGKFGKDKKTSDVAKTGTPQFKAAGPPAGPPSIKRILPLPGGKKKKKKVKTAKKFTSKLTPLTIGPHWSSDLGQPAHSTFAEYQIEFLNDAYVGLDPFTFVSADLKASTCATVGEVSSSVPSTAETSPMRSQDSPVRGTKFGPMIVNATTAPTNGSPLKGSLQSFLNSGVNTMSPADSPSHTATTAEGGSTSSATLSSTSTGGGGGGVKSVPLVPEEYLVPILQAIEGSTDTKMFLLEKLAAHYKEVRSVTKVAISNTLNLVAERTSSASGGGKRGGTWRIKEEWRVRAALDASGASSSSSS